MALETDYEVLIGLGEGAFGKVYKARHRSSGDIVAVKQIKLGAKSWQEACRSTELQALKALRHPYIVRLRELLRSPGDGSLYYVFEFVNSDLLRFVKAHPGGAGEKEACRLTKQLLSGLAHMHQYGFFHRDIKPENILFNLETSTVRIADFGASRSLRARPPFTDYVGTRWYRAPECLLGSRVYSSPVDVWAVGLVFAELLRGSPLFMGQSSIDQLHKIFQVLGCPDTSATSDWPELTSLMEGLAVRFRGLSQMNSRGIGMERVLGKTSATVQAIMSEMLLVLNPRRRATAKRCADHPIFAADGEELPGTHLPRVETPPVHHDNDADLRAEEELPSAPSTASPSIVQEAPRAAKFTERSADEPRPESGSFPPTLACQSQDGKRSGARPATTALDLRLDVDIDDELDRILGSSETEQAGPAGGGKGRQGAGERALTGPFSPKSRRAAALSGTQSHQRHLQPTQQPSQDEPQAVDDLLQSLNMELSELWQGPLEDQGAKTKAGWNQRQQDTERKPDRMDDASEAIGAQRHDTSHWHRGEGSGGGQLSMPSSNWNALTGLSAARTRSSSAQPSALSARHQHTVDAILLDEDEDKDDDWDSPVAHDHSAERIKALDGQMGNPKQPQHQQLLLPAQAHSSSDRETRRSASKLEPLPSASSERVSGKSTSWLGMEVTAETFSALPWTRDETKRLRRIVKRLSAANGVADKEALWQQVSSALGGGRPPPECQAQYFREYKAHKAAATAERVARAGRLPCARTARASSLSALTR